MIIKAVVTTCNEKGEVNMAPMGITFITDRQVLIKPFLTSDTYKNLMVYPSAVINLTDDVYVIAKTALSNEVFPCVPATKVKGFLLQDASASYEIEVIHKVVEEPRAVFTGKIKKAHSKKQHYKGLNRGKLAVVEAAILATRQHLFHWEVFQGKMLEYAIIVEKTGGDNELKAMSYIKNVVERTQARKTGGEKNFDKNNNTGKASSGSN